MTNTVVFDTGDVAVDTGGVAVNTGGIAVDSHLLKCDHQKSYKRIRIDTKCMVRQ